MKKILGSILLFTEVCLLAVAQQTPGQVDGHSTTGSTAAGISNVFLLNPGWNLNQMTALFSRFNGVKVNSYSITSNVVTMQGINAFNAGDTPDLLYFPNSTFFNNNKVTILPTGLSNTQFEFAFTHADVSPTTETGYASLNVPAQPQVSNGVVIIPPGLVDQPSNAFYNTSVIGPAGQVIDTRKGYWFQQVSGYGVKCDAQTIHLTITAGSNQVDVGSSFGNINPVGMTMVVGQQLGFGQGGTQNVWTPTVTVDTYPGTLTLSAKAPFSYKGPAIFGTNNQAALQRAFNDVGGLYPLYLPACTMLTDTLRWNGANLIGQQMNFTKLIGFPGHDILQQQDGTAIKSWSINAGTGVTTFTIPAYSAHNILVGDSVKLKNFPKSTFFNNHDEYIASQPTPTSFTVNSAFGQSTSSAAEAGVAAPNTNAGTNGLRMENVQFDVNNSIDPTFPWNQYDASGNLTVEPPMYRPLQEFGQPMNHPFAPGWGAGQVNGVATITQNTSVICVPTGKGARQPATGATIVFPYQAGGLVSRTVSSTSGSCSPGLAPFTLSSALPNTSGYTATQAEWFTYTTPQTLAVAIPATITYPHTITLALAFPPVPGWEANVSSHGRIEINGDQFDYMGDNFGGTAGGSPTLVLRDGPTSINGGKGDAIGQIVFPLNPCNAMYNNPWPVVPTLNSGAATPLYATYYAGICGGNAGMSFPSADTDAWVPQASGLSVAHFIDIAGAPTSSNSLGNQDNNGAMLMYQAGNNTGYGNTFDNLRGEYLWGGFMQGPSSVNQHGVRSVGPTSTGQSIKNCTFRTGYAITLINMEQSNIDRCDTYSSETSPYDGTSVGASTGLYLGYSLSEQDGKGVTNVAQFTVKDYNNEPENGNHYENSVAVESDGAIVNWIGTIFEGGYNIFGGAYQIFHGTQLSNPVFNYGSNNYFEHMSGLNTGYFSQVYTGYGFYNWGNYAQGECSNGNNGGANTLCGIGFVQSYNGHDAFATMMGDTVHPNENLLGGMILQGEWAEAGLPVVSDATELWWGSHAECRVGPGLECISLQFDGFNGYVYIGPHQRITNARMVLKMNVMAKSAGTFKFRVLLTAQNPSRGSICTPNYSLAQGTYTATSRGWTPVQLPVDFSGYAGCSLGVQFDNGTAANTLEIGYFNFVPFTGQLYIPLATHTVGAPCPVAGEISLDSAHLWTCSPTSGTTFGPGTWQEH